MALKKAMIEVDRGHSKERIDVMFNPTEYSMGSSNKYSFKMTPGLSLPIAQFVSGESTTLSMDLFFDTYEAGSDVRKQTMQIAGLLDVDKGLHTPPLCTFVWGTLLFEGIVEKVSQKYTMFLDSGIPVRATLQVTFRAVQSVTKQLKKNPRQSAGRTKQRTVKQGDQLWQIAAEEYEDPGLWREIARANRIKNPKKLEPGTVIKIPRLNG